MTDHIAEWKYWSDEVLDQVQSFYESDCGYNGECDHVWVAVKNDKYKLPAIENKFKYALVVAATNSNREREKIMIEIEMWFKLHDESNKSFMSDDLVEWLKEKRMA